MIPKLKCWNPEYKGSVKSARGAPCKKNYPDAWKLYPFRRWIGSISGMNYQQVPATVHLAANFVLANLARGG